MKRLMQPGRVQCLETMISGTYYLFHLYLFSISLLTSLYPTSHSFDLGLEKFGVDVDELKQPANKRIFRAWIEEWEEKMITDPDVVAEATLREKYKNLFFIDIDDKKKTVYRIHEKNLEFHRKNKKRGIEAGWGVIAIPRDDPDDEPEAWQIGEDLIELIASTPQEEGVEIIHNEKGTAGGKDGDISSSSDE